MLYKKSLIISALFFWLTSITFGDNVPPSKNPPEGLDPDNVPQFVNWGFDDGYGYDGIRFILDYFKDKTNPVGPSNNPLTFDGTPARVSFYINSSNVEGEEPLFKELIADGHEVANHTANHFNGGTDDVSGFPPHDFDVQGWLNEINNCTDSLHLFTGIDKSKVVGFRVPFLSFNLDCYSALSQSSLVYDCSLHGDSWQGNPSNLNWPYTLNSGDPGQNVGTHPGFWEVPTHYVDGTITGLDFNMIEKSSWGGLEMSKTEFVNKLKYMLDQRYNGNRAPMTFGAHCHYYGQQDEDNVPNMTLQQRQDAFAEFFDYALSLDDVRVVPTIAIIEWMRNPIGLDQTPIIANTEKTAQSLSLLINSNTIRLAVPADDFYTCRLYTVNGKLIKTIAEGYYLKGSYSLPLSKRDLAPGSYFVKLKGSNESRTLKIVSM